MIRLETHGIPSTLSLIDFKVLRGGGQVGIIVDRLLGDLQVVTQNRIFHCRLPSCSLVWGFFDGCGVVLFSLNLPDHNVRSWDLFVSIWWRI